jgi:hypothetical protein
MKTSHLLSGLSLFALNNQLHKPINQCGTAEEEAELLQKMMHEQGGQPDPEEMQAYLRKARGLKNRKPPQFQRLNGPIKMLTMFMQN